MIDISIIIPSYNRLWSLPETIKSCTSELLNIEVVVIDDGSTDGTWEWLEKQKNIISIRQNNLGKCWAVNEGFKIASGKYIRFVDSDDTLSSGANEEQFQIAEQTTADVVVSGHFVIDESGKVIREHSWHFCDDFIAQQLGECDSSHYSAYLFRKSFIQDIPHRPDFAYRDDRRFILEVAIKHPKYQIHQGFALKHRHHNNNRLQFNTNLKQAVQNFQHLNIYKDILDILKNKGELTERRIDASINILWPLTEWIAKFSIQDASEVFEWIKILKPQFKIQSEGLKKILYKILGFRNTSHILALRRRLFIFR